MNSILFSSKSVEWSTPDHLFKVLNDKYHFTLDPCASDTNHKCDLYYTVKDNGLCHSWKGQIVFCNPPFIDNKSWAYKCYYEFIKNKTKICLLIPARTDTEYFHKYILPFARIEFIRGRVHFNDSKHGAPFPVILCFYGL